VTESPGGATVRSVRVVMDASIDSYVAKMRTAGNETDRSFDRIERRLGTTSTSLRDVERNLDGVSRAERTVSASTDGLNNRLGRSNSQLDSFSGRTRIILQLVGLLGPGIVRLGAAGVPVFSALAVGAGAAALGIGATVLAFKGIGDALEALDTYQLSRTPEDLAKVREEFAAIGPAGRDFVRYLDSIEPELRELQIQARNGLLPGAEEGLDNLLTMLPELRFLIKDTSKTVGDLMADGGESLAGEDFEAFFDYLRTDAAPTLDAMGRTVGNFALAFSNLLVGLAPATRDATGGILGWSEDLANASKNLDDNEGFQEFLDYIRDAGPAAADFFGSLAGLLGSVAQAAAPYGAVVIPVLTATADVLSLIAGSPAGPILVAAAAGLTLYGRAAAFAGPQIAKLKAGGLGAAASGLNPYAVLAAGATVAITQIVAADDDLVAATRRAQDALDSGDTSQMQAELDELNAKLEETKVNLYPDERADTFAERFKEGIPVIGRLGDTLEGAGDLWTKFTSAEEDADRARADLEAGIASGGSIIDRYMRNISQTADALLRQKAAEDAAREAMQARHEEALGAFDAETRYAQAIRDATKQSKRNNDGINENTKAGRNNRDMLSELAGAWNEHEDAVKNNVYAYRNARKNFIDTAVAMGVPRQAARDLARALLDIPKDTKPKIHVDDANSLEVITGVDRALAGLRDKTIHITTVHVNGHSASIVEPHASIPQASGGTIPGPRTPYRDKVLTYLAPGEEVISNRNGQADRNRPLLKRINAGRFADGGSISVYPRTPGRLAADALGADDTISRFNRGSLDGVARAADRATRGLKGLEKQADKVSNAYDRQKSKLDNLTGDRASYASSVASTFRNDAFGNGLAGFDAQVGADTNDARAMTAALRVLVKHGLDPQGALFRDLAASGDLNTAQQLAALSATQLNARERSYGERDRVTAAEGAFAGDKQFNEAIRAQTKATEKLERRLEHLQDAIRDLKHLPKHVEDGARAGTQAGAEDGTRRGWQVRDQDTATRVRTQPKPVVKGR
jgi:hypothetical protein